MPSSLEPGVLYVSLAYSTAAHLCACGCNSKIRTPLGPTEWSFADDSEGPTLTPSVGNWQLPCKSHYVLTGGNILWSGQWTEDQVLAGRNHEMRVRQKYYNNRNKGFFNSIYEWVGKLFVR
ncbi:MAG: DUF6527 family protein [Aquidulcibacter sp.]|jgi:hypothetical protein|nr:DUF6527 family protein [Aquidulcibacter sp.]